MRKESLARKTSTSFLRGAFEHQTVNIEFKIVTTNHRNETSRHQNWLIIKETKIEMTMTSTSDLYISQESRSLLAWLPRRDLRDAYRE